MALALAYTQVKAKKAYDRVVIAGPDAHGVSLLAARLRILRRRGENVLAYAKFPDTTPRAAAETFTKIAEQYEAIKGTEILDIPLNVQAPAAFIEALAKLPQPVRFYDHHETSTPFVEQMIQRGIIPIITADAVQMAVALELFNDNVAKELAIIGIVADRDSAILKILAKDEIERKYMPLASKLDILVRNPRLANAEDQAKLAEMLSEYGAEMLSQINVEYPPEKIANEVPVIKEGDIALVADFTSLDPAATSMWVPKTMEQLAMRRGKHIVIAVVPGYNPRTRTLEGYDVRIIRYWLSNYPLTAEELARDVIQRMAPQGRVVGHENYVSVRFSSVEEARRIAEEIFQRIEGMQSTVAHLVNDSIVAQAVRRDFQAILDKLSEILEQQKKMYEEYLELKRRQVELLERTQHHEYD